MVSHIQNQEKEIINTLQEFRGFCKGILGNLYSDIKSKKIKKKIPKNTYEIQDLMGSSLGLAQYIVLFKSGKFFFNRKEVFAFILEVESDDKATLYLAKFDLEDDDFKIIQKEATRIAQQLPLKTKLHVQDTY